MSSINRYFMKLAADSAFLSKPDYYLWPRTPTANLQAEIWQRVGVSDHMMYDCRSRPSKIIRMLHQLIDNKLLREDFNLLDICCGDAVILTHIQRSFPDAHCYGIDLNAWEYADHSDAFEEGVELYAIPMQILFQRPAPVQLDVCVMLNTYRSWDAADLRLHERNLPYLADDWFKQNSKYTILTVTPSQNKRLRRKGFWVIGMGRGEDDSEMVCVFTCEK